MPYALFVKVHERASTPAAKTASLVCGTLALGLPAGVCIAFPSLAAASATTSATATATPASPTAAASRARSDLALVRRRQQ